MERATGAVKLKIAAIDFLERDVRLRMPFRFGVVTLTESPQAFVRCRIRTEDGREAEGSAAELLAPKWFDKNPALSNEDNYEQLRDSLRAARKKYLAHDAETAWRHSSPGKGLVENYGPALLDRAILDAACRSLDVSFYEAIRRNLIGAEDFEGLKLAQFFAKLRPGKTIAARHTRMVEGILFIEQPVKRQNALARPVKGIDKPVIIDESDDSLDAFPRAKALGYKGVSSKTCKGIYKSLINRARCDAWNREKSE